MLGSYEMHRVNPLFRGPSDDVEPATTAVMGGVDKNLATFFQTGQPVQSSVVVRLCY